jgi:hypothetical protein
VHKPHVDCCIYVSIGFGGCRYGYALYASVGCFDLNSTDSLTLLTIKTIITTPVTLSLREDIKAVIDEAW